MPLNTRLLMFLLILILKYHLSAQLRFATHNFKRVKNVFLFTKIVLHMPKYGF